VPYPTDLPGRRLRRDTIRAQVLAEAERHVQLVGRIRLCAHYNVLAPACRDDGTNCLCDCYDPTGPARSETRQ
jgi:hypothetical protein